MRASLIKRGGKNARLRAPAAALDLSAIIHGAAVIIQFFARVLGGPRWPRRGRLFDSMSNSRGFRDLVYLFVYSVLIDRKKMFNG